jgi:para-aminobenzoate synthetase / 4-amino-4-deoxychorismate lyase
VARHEAPDRASGVFETLLVLDGAPVELDAHLARLRASVRSLFGAEPPGEIVRRALEASAALPFGRLRLTVAPAAGGASAAGVTPAAGVAASALVADVTAHSVDSAQLFPPWERAVALDPLTIAGGLGAHKWVDRRRLATAASVAGSDRLPLVLDEREEVLELSRANVFAVEDGVLLTPAADGRILPGVGRARAIDIARALGVELREEPFDLSRLLAAGEAFVTGSVRGVEPVGTVGDAALAAPGEEARAVAAELRQRWIGVRASGSPAAVR